MDYVGLAHEPFTCFAGRPARGRFWEVVSTDGQEILEQGNCAVSKLGLTLQTHQPSTVVAKQVFRCCQLFFDSTLFGSEALKNEEVVRLLSHLRHINAGVLELVSEAGLEGYITPALLAEVSESPEEMEAPQVVYLLREILNLRRQMGLADPSQGYRSMEQVRRKQQELVDEHICFLQRHEDERLARLRKEEYLPEPPMPGTPAIVPILRGSEIREEGRAQHHCVGSYVSSTGRGECYIYRVLSPERATLSITKRADGCWHIQQLCLACNQPVSPATRTTVQAWLNCYSCSI